MTPNLPAVIAELKRLRDNWASVDRARVDAWCQERDAYAAYLLGNADTLIAAAEECAAIHAELPTIEAKLDEALRLHQARAEECERLREALDKIRQAEPCTHEGSCFYPRHDGDGNFISDDHVDPLSVIQDIVGIARAALEGKI